MSAEADAAVSPRSVDVDVFHLNSHRESTRIGMPSNTGDECDSFLVDMNPLPVGHAKADAFIVSDGDYDSQSSTPDTDIDSHGTAKSGDIVNHLQDQLISWSLLFKIPMNALYALLAILQLHFPALPKDARMLQRTPTFSNNIKQVCDGTCYYFGLANILNRSSNEVPTSGVIDMQINIDGLPLFKSSFSDALNPTTWTFYPSCSMYEQLKSNGVSDSSGNICFPIYLCLYL